eukprot:TRINITY_DN17095_c2_g1_i3.p1 TRINITY_DN17095_c2_g1~~TRINITY_DN17095_c2_g1_i3.p1  ORF type:complete len:202 (+),score=-6.78 TRINITY_DN17095_c2_g1_i3:134-739(+)
MNRLYVKTIQVVQYSATVVKHVSRDCRIAKESLCDAQTQRPFVVSFVSIFFVIINTLFLFISRKLNYFLLVLYFCSFKINHIDFCSCLQYLDDQIQRFLFFQCYNYLNCCQNCSFKNLVRNTMIDEIWIHSKRDKITNIKILILMYFQTDDQFLTRIKKSALFLQVVCVKFFEITNKCIKELFIQNFVVFKYELKIIVIFH